MALCKCRILFVSPFSRDHIDRVLVVLNRNNCSLLNVLMEKFDVFLQSIVQMYPEVKLHECKQQDKLHY